MKHINLAPLRYIFIIPFLLLFRASFGQSQQIENLETNIDQKRNLTETQHSIEALRQQALKTKNDVLYARTLQDLIQIRDQRTEDTLYFRNSAFIDTLLRQPVSPKLKAILHIVQAQRLRGFNAHYKRFNAGAYRTPNLPNNYAAMTARALDSLADLHMEEALKYRDKTPDKELLWLSSNQDVFLFDPALEDIAIAEKINYHAFDNAAKTNHPNWLSLASKAFQDSLANVDQQHVLSLYNRWIRMHQDDAGIAGFIQSLARKQIFYSTGRDSVTQKNYTHYLAECTSSPYKILRAHAVYQLCLLWNEDGNKYCYWGGLYGFEVSRFQPQYQYDCNKALNLYRDNQAIMENYPLLNKVLAAMEKQILATKVRIEIDDKQLTGQPIALRVMYRNTGVFNYRIVRITAAEAALNSVEEFDPQMLKRTAIAEGKLELPLPADHNKHAVNIKLDGLPAGHYRILFSATDLNRSAKADVYSLRFEVTGIAAINSDERVFVLDYKTGKPLAGAQVVPFSKTTLTALGQPHVAAADGHADIEKSKADSLRIVYKGDTTGIRFSVRRNELNNDDVFNKDDHYDDLLDFYDDKLHTEIFTDRAIYRPGQTVHYKVIFITNNPKTGAPMLFNSSNVGGFLFNNRLKKWLDNGHQKITLEDPFNKKIDSAAISINEYGSFAGSFVIPKTAATGQWEFGGLPEPRNNYGRFRVEEYKRPSIELTMEKQQKKLLPGEPFSIKLKLRSFSGADLGNVPIKYTISRSGLIPAREDRGIPAVNMYQEVKLSAKTGYTNEKGELLVAVNDTLLVRAILPDSLSWNYNYNIDATATDATGESKDLDERVAVSSWPVKINVSTELAYDRQKPIVLKIGTTDDFEGVSNHKVRLMLYEINDLSAQRNQVNAVDQWIYPVADWNNWFPAKAYLPAPKRIHQLVLDTLINAKGFENFTLSSMALKAASYEIVATVTEHERRIGQFRNTFTVFDSDGGPQPDMDYLPNTSAKAGDVLTWQSAGLNARYTIYHVLYASGGKHTMQKSIYETIAEKAGVNTWNYKIPADAVGQLILSRISIYNGQIYTHRKYIAITQVTEPMPEIIVERYRKVMTPGSKETFTLSVKTKNDNVAAELVTTLYDATLDKLNRLNWQTPYPGRNRSIYLNAAWPYSLNSKRIIGSYNDDNMVMMREITTRPGKKFTVQQLEGRLSGLDITSAAGLNEVVVVGYGTQAKRSLTGAVSSIMIRGTGSIADYNQPLVIVDGEVYTDKLKNLPAEIITEAVILKGADASAIYGSRAAQGVLVISTKGPIVFPQAAEPEVKVRKDFNETAFFFPQVHADKDGFYTFSFTMPESATEWNWKVMAHTRDARFAYLERKLQTQLNLMVQPNMPRLLYQGDKIKLQSRISNLDTLAVKGKATCKIEDAVTGEDITAKLLGANSQEFSLGAKSSGSVAFMLQVPADQLNPLKIVISATSGSAADAEEHVLPVLSPRVFVRQSQRVAFDAQPSLSIQPVKLPADASLYGMSLSVNPKPQSSLINALPWLANYSYDCAEQTFNKIRALAAALRLMQRDTLAQRSFKNASASIDQQKTTTGQLPDDMAEAAMPWLGISNHATDQQKKLFKLLDTSVTKTTIDAKLNRLYKLQQTDGGLSWFDGGESSEYISSYVLAGFGQLKQLGWKPASQKVREQTDFVKKLVKYHEDLLLKTTLKVQTDIYPIYAISAWAGDYPLSDALQNKVEIELRGFWNSVDHQSLGEQALLIITTLKLTKPNSELNLKAHKQLENMSQLAITDAQNGMRWKDIADSEDLSFSAEETMALLAEAFNQGGNYKNVQPGIVKWLLTTRQDDHWQTTKATAAAIDMLQKEQGTVFGENKAFSAAVSGQNLTVSDDLLNGTPTVFAPVKQQPQQINLQQNGSGASGAVTWYYFTATDKLDTLNKAIKLKKQFYKYTEGKGWQPLAAGAVLKTGDKIQVKLTVDASIRLTFVHISDPRAAAFEPKDNNSGYQYARGFTYYQSVRDTGLELFAEAIPKGISEINYELVVAHDGEFGSGPAQLQCMYKPSITAYSSTAKISVE